MQLQAGKLLLRPVTVEDARWLFDLYVNEETGFRWNLEGQIPSFSEFLQVEDSLSMYLQKLAIVDLAQERPIGVAVLGPFDQRNGTAQFGCCLDPAARGGGRGILPAALLWHYAFERVGFRKLYSYSIDFNHLTFFKRLGLHMQVEGCLKEHHYFQGRYWDVRIFACLRDEWERFSARWGARLFRDLEYRD